MTRPPLVRKVTISREIRRGGLPYRRATVEGKHVGCLATNVGRRSDWQFFPNQFGERCGMSTCSFPRLDDFRRAVQPDSVTNCAKALYRNSRFRRQS